MLTTLSLLGAVAVALAPAAGRAQGAAGAPRELTLDDALAMARKANRSLAVERVRLSQAQANLDQAWSSLFPTIALQGKYSRYNVAVSFPNSKPPPTTLNIQKLDQVEAGANFSMPLIVPSLFPAIEAVKTGVKAAEANFEVSEDSILFGVAQTFYACAIADEVSVARRSSVEVARVTLDNARTRFAAGAVTKVDVDRAELALVRSQQAEREANLGQQQSYRALATLIQAPQAFRVQPPPGAGPPPATQDLDAVLHLRPEFRALELAVQSSQAQSRAYAWRWAPGLSAFGNARAFNYDSFGGQHYAWVAGLQLDWVIFDGGARSAQKALAAAQAAESQARAEVLRDTIRDDLANGKSALETKTQARQAAERSVELARETIELVRTQYENGNVTQVDLLQAQDNLVAAQEALAQAHFDVALADLTVRRAAGTFPGR
jgi:outer membrane protein TolC